MADAPRSLTTGLRARFVGFTPTHLRVSIEVPRTGERVYDSVVFDANEETPGYSELRKVENAGLVFSRPSARALSFRGFQ